MDGTARWAMPMLFAGQAQKELHHNEALTLIDALLHGQVQSADVGVPPGAPTPGQCWIVADGASGAWTGQAGAVASWSEGGWRFIAPRAGLRMDVADRGHAFFHDGTQWRSAAIREDGFYLNEQRVIGERRDAISAPSGGGVIDVEVRSAVLDILLALRAHGLIAT